MLRASLGVCVAGLVGLALVGCGGDDGGGGGGGCGVGTSDCDGTCRDLDADPNHCGGCGNACAATEICRAGRCTTECPEGLTDCAGSCLDVDYDPANCGVCGNTCGANEFCVEGSCDSSCGDLTDCDGICRDTRVDPAHCGGCDTACGDGEFCVGGRCEGSCGDLAECDGICRDLDTDRDHCGACDSPCAPGEVCDGEGICALSCQEGLSDCDGTCRDLTSDRTNCESCGNACADGEICVDSACVLSCGEGLTACDDACVDTDTDIDHCGGCDRPCDLTCLSGMCAFAFNGVARNLRETALLGWAPCYRGTYGQSDQDFSACDGDHLLLACRPVGRSELTLAAHGPRADVMFDTGDADNDVTRTANGVEWYFHGDRSWGFARLGDTVDKVPCDFGGANPEDRMCWHMDGDQIQSGYRCGANDLNGNDAWERIIYQPTAAELVGSYVVSDGEDWWDDPPTYSCVEACALLFEGDPDAYRCSTNDVAINALAHVDGWGDRQYCLTPAAEDFKLNDHYDCGAVRCAYSAYVRDHFGECNVRNYCWR